jgi:hypothetical protein
VAKDQPNNVVRLAFAGTTAPPTMAEIAEIDFEPIDQFVNFGNNIDQLTAHEQKLRDFAIATRLAIGLLGQSKAELIDRITTSDTHDSHAVEQLLESLMDAEGLADDLRDMIRTAHLRLGVAMTASLPSDARF